MNFSGKVVLTHWRSLRHRRSDNARFIKAGAKVAFTYLTSAEEAVRIEREAEEAGTIARGFNADASQPDTVTQLFLEVEAHLGPVDVVFANAGGLIKRSRCVDATLDLWQEAMSINVFSTFLTVQAALRSMEKRGAGAIVTMSSLAGFDGGGMGASHYAASKAAVATFTRALARRSAHSAFASTASRRA